MEPHRVGAWLVRLVLVFATPLVVTSQASAEPSPTDLACGHPDSKEWMEGLQTAAAESGRIWLQNDQGGISFVDLSSRKRVPESLAGCVRAVYRTQGGQLLAVSDHAVEQWIRLWVREKSGWRRSAQMPRGAKERTLGVTEHDEVTIVLSTEAAISVEPDGTFKRLPWKLGYEGRGTYSFATTRDGVLYAGTNVGEWGGSLRWLDLRTGRSGPVTSPAAKSETIDQRLERPDYGPFTSLMRDPTRPNCIVAAVGLHHFFPRGQLVRACRSKATRLYRRSLGVDGTVGFFALTESAGTVLAAGSDGVYRSTDLLRFEKLAEYPEKFEDAGAYVWTRIPGIILVLTSINQRNSVGGATPLLLPYPDTSQKTPSAKHP